MKRAESGDLDVNFNVKYNDEIGHLGNSFNTMLIEIRKLIDAVYREQKSKRKAELKILQAQIKPHFLYNTLDTIHWMVKKYGADDVIDVINALTSLFRIGLSKGNEVIRVSEEIEHVRSYLFIQKVRYRQLLNYEIAAEDQVQSLYVQKIILQPIVENAIYHGIKPNKVPGTIEIKVELKEDKLILTVTDNGCGIPEEQLQAINEALENDSTEKMGYGLFNVNERIRLSYGKEFGITLNSETGVGTVVEIRLPIIT
jgi:two-component system, sensor histidine kinase YesM